MPRRDTPSSYIDLDHIKPVNDTHGHAAGDEVLQVIARRLQGLVRRDDIVVRLGGDEFAIVQSGIAGAAGAETLAARGDQILRRSPSRSARIRCAWGPASVSRFAWEGVPRSCTRYRSPIARCIARRGGGGCLS
ncbi:MAG: GGDEF domain-containing protein [Gemmatimonadetes bacterium]|nr:GGDEF domain-containing protein [Gemmatimonadota bacterium]